ncbi:MAG: sigma-70 family RNA polymerase sigma factor [Sphingomonas sp.]
MTGRFWPRLVRSTDGAPAADGQARDKAERFRRAMLPHMDAAYMLARYLTRDPDAAEDVVQDAFLRAYRSFDGWRGDAAKAWLLAIVRNCFLTSVAGTAGRPPLRDLDGWTEDLPPELIEARSPETLLTEKSEAAMLRATIEQLPEPFREALVLRELEELSYRDIATITAVPIGTVMSRLARARQMLAELLLPDDAREAQA